MSLGAQLLAVEKLPHPMANTYLIRITNEERELLLDALKAFTADWSDTFSEQGRPKGGVRVVAEHVFRVLNETSAKLRNAMHEQIVA